MNVWSLYCDPLELPLIDLSFWQARGASETYRVSDEVFQRIDDIICSMRSRLFTEGIV